jgi:hypothetical protein
VEGGHHVLEVVVAGCPRHVLEADLELMTACHDAGQDLIRMSRIEVRKGVKDLRGRQLSQGRAVQDGRRGGVGACRVAGPAATKARLSGSLP